MRADEGGPRTKKRQLGEGLNIAMIGLVCLRALIPGSALIGLIQCAGLDYVRVLVEEPTGKAQKVVADYLCFTPSLLVFISIKMLFHEGFHQKGW